MHPIVLSALIALTAQAISITGCWFLARKTARDIAKQQVADYRSSITLDSNASNSAEDGPSNESAV